MTFVDTHCHLDKYKQPAAVLKAADTANVITVAVTELPSAFQRLAVRLGKRKGVRLALGFHPLKAGRGTPLELALFTSLLDRCEYVGEVGLDRSQHGRESFRAQVRVFEHLLEQPRVKDKVLTVHSRGAETETIDRLAQAEVAAILHWYSGPLKHIETALDAGLWFSVNPAMLRSQSGQRLVSALPRDRVVTETDGPYSKVGRRPSEPSDIPSVVAGLAKIWAQNEDEARAQVFANMTAVAEAARSRGS